MMSATTDTAVIMIVFNRPRTTRRVFERIRESRPRRLYVAADGPRPDRADDEIKCAEVRSIVGQVDWPCDVRTSYRDRNIGCKLAVKSALDWFFAHEEEGIILEDDCVPEPTFFRFCSEMLRRFRHDDRIASISGTNYLLGSQSFDASYYFTKYLFVWGWASWRRIWREYDFEMMSWPTFRASGHLKSVFPQHPSFRYWRMVFDMTHGGKLDTFDYQLFYSALINSRLSVVPARNLVANIGWGDGSTNTAHRNPEMGMPTYPMSFPLQHPLFVVPDERADRFTERLIFAKPLHRKIRNRTKRLFLQAID